MRLILLALICTASILRALSPVEQECLDTVAKANTALRKVQLDNGLVCLIYPDRSAPVVAVQIWIGCGAMHEGPWLGGGLSHGLEHMVFKGTPKYPGNAFTKLLNDAGGALNAYTANDRTVYHVRLPAASWKLGIDTLGDAVQNCSLPPETWASEQSVILREMAMCEDDPGRQLFRSGMEQLYRVHPYRVPIIGYADVFKSMTAENLDAYHKLFYTPDNMIVSVAGAIDPDEVEARIREVFSGAKRRARAATVFPQEPAISSPRAFRKEGDYQQTRILRAWHTVPQDHPDAPALDVLSAWLSSGRASRLTRIFQDELELVNDIGAYSSNTSDMGCFAVFADVAPEKEEAFLKAFDAELATWKSDTISGKELDRVRRQFIVSQLGKLTSMEGLAGTFASNQYYTGNPFSSELYLKALLQVQPEDIRRVAEKYITATAWAQAILAPTGKKAAAASVATAAAVPVRKTINGVPVIIRSDTRLPLVTVTVSFKAGLLWENESNNGITSFAADLMTRGSGDYSKDELDAAFESRGASLGSFAGNNSMGLSFTSLSGDADKLFPFFKDCLLNPAFPEAECAKRRAVQIAGIQSRTEDPGTVAWDNLRKAIFGKHPYGFDASGTTNAVAQFTSDTLKTYIAGLLTRSNVTVSVFGNLSPAKAEAFAAELINELPDTPVAPAASAPQKLAASASIETREPRKQAVVFLGWQTAGLDSRAAERLTVLATIMNGMTSDLFAKVREKRGLAYYVRAQTLRLNKGGVFSMHAGTEEKNVPEVEALMRSEIARLAKSGPRPDELARAVETLSAAADTLPQNNAGYAGDCSLMELLGLGFDYTAQTRARFSKLTAADIQSAAAEIEASPCVRSVVLPRP